MSINRVIVSGEVSRYGPKVEWTSAGKAQTSFSLVLDKGDYKTFIPCLCVSANAEEMAETFNAGDWLLLEGSLSWKAGRTKDAGRLQVVCFGVEVLAQAGGPGEEAEEELSDADGDGAYRRTIVARMAGRSDATPAGDGRRSHRPGRPPDAL